MNKKTWNPYISGALTGLLLVLSVWIAGKFLGASTTFARRQQKRVNMALPPYQIGSCYSL